MVGAAYASRWGLNLVSCHTSPPQECAEGEAGGTQGFRNSGMRHLAMRNGPLAAACFRRALRSPALSQDERLALQRQLTLALQLSGRLEQAAKAAQQVVSLAEAMDDESALADALEVGCLGNR